MGCCASAASTTVVKSAYIKSSSSSANNHNKNASDINSNHLLKSSSNEVLTPAEEYHSHLHHSAQKSNSDSALYNSNKYAIQVGQLESYYDLEFNGECRRPGWSDEQRGGGGPAYNIFLERELGMRFIIRLQEHPALGRLPLTCVGHISRTEYRGQEVIAIKLTHSEGKRFAIFDCAKLLRATGPMEFRHVLAYYGEDPIRPMISREEDTRRSQLITQE